MSLGIIRETNDVNLRIDQYLEVSIVYFDIFLSINITLAKTTCYIYPINGLC